MMIIYLSPTDGFNRKKLLFMPRHNNNNNNMDFYRHRKKILNLFIFLFSFLFFSFGEDFRLCFSISFGSSPGGWFSNLVFK